MHIVNLCEKWKVQIITFLVSLISQSHIHTRFRADVCTLIEASENDLKNESTLVCNLIPRL